MKKAFYVALFSLVVALGCYTAVGTANSASVGKPAPAFALTDTAGQSHSLAQYKGKFVVLEWVNFDCPFVRKHYDSGNMQKLQKEFTAKGVVWLSINSSAPGKQGNFTPEKAAALVKERGASPTAYLFDTDGQVGKQYGARSTPHMFVINPQGDVIYNGAIDDKPSTNTGDISTAKNYVRAALEEAMAGKSVSVAASQPYGCSVKY